MSRDWERSLNRTAKNLVRKVEDLEDVAGEIAEDINDEFEVLDVSDRGWLKRNFGDLTKASVAKQVTVGGVSGWCAGYLFGKVGKAAAAGVGGSLLVLQIAHHQGYVSINWGKLEKEVKTARKNFNKKADKMIPAIAQEVSEFVAENAFLAGGFAAGFLLGIAS